MELHPVIQCLLVAHVHHCPLLVLHHLFLQEYHQFLLIDRLVLLALLIHLHIIAVIEPHLQLTLLLPEVLLQCLQAHPFQGGAQ